MINKIDFYRLNLVKKVIVVLLVNKIGQQLLFLEF